jgi:hypothetical protein
MSPDHSSQTAALFLADFERRARDIDNHTGNKEWLESKVVALCEFLLAKGNRKFLSGVQLIFANSAAIKMYTDSGNYYDAALTTGRLIAAAPSSDHCTLAVLNSSFAALLVIGNRRSRTDTNTEDIAIGLIQALNHLGAALTHTTEPSELIGASVVESTRSLAYLSTTNNCRDYDYLFNDYGDLLNQYPPQLMGPRPATYVTFALAKLQLAEADNQPNRVALSAAIEPLEASKVPEDLALARAGLQTLDDKNRDNSLALVEIRGRLVNISSSDVNSIEYAAALTSLFVAEYRAKLTVAAQHTLNSIRALPVKEKEKSSHALWYLSVFEQLEVFDKPESGGLFTSANVIKRVLAAVTASELFDSPTVAALARCSREVPVQMIERLNSVARLLLNPKYYLQWRRISSAILLACKEIACTDIIKPEIVEGCFSQTRFLLPDGDSNQFDRIYAIALIRAGMFKEARQALQTAHVFDTSEAMEKWDLKLLRAILELSKNNIVLARTIIRKCESGLTQIDAPTVWDYVSTVLALSVYLSLLNNDQKAASETLPKLLKLQAIHKSHKRCLVPGNDTPIVEDVANYVAILRANNKLYKLYFGQ